MMDIARHGIFRPEHFYFSELMCLFLAVVASDVILLDLFNMLGLPTSTTVSMVFELLGGSTALAMMKMSHDHSLTYAQLINTDKALSVILAIFLSVAIAFVFGLVVQWIARLIFTFHYKKHIKYTIGLFGGVSLTVIFYFLLSKGIGTSTLVSPAGQAWIADQEGVILWGGLLVFTLLMQVLHWLKVNVFRIIVLFGTFSLAMAFAGNDLVNFIGVTLAGFSSFQDFSAHPGADPSSFVMTSLNDPAHTPLIFLFLTGTIMIVSLLTSKKAKNVVKTSVDLARQSAGEEMFGSSRLSRSLVRAVLNTNDKISSVMPSRVKQWLNNRFDTSVSDIPAGAAFDQVRASVNLVLAGLIIVMGTSLKLPLSTTYIAFMVAMGSSLADRAWGRESAVFRVTGVISVIGGWFITAGAAFFLCFTVTSFLYFGGFIAKIILIGLVAFMLVQNNIRYKKRMERLNSDETFTRLTQTNDKAEAWTLLDKHVADSWEHLISFVTDSYKDITDGLINDDVKVLRKTLNQLDKEKKYWKVMRRKEMFGMRSIDPMLAMQKNTWFHLGHNSIEQCLYCLKRMCEPALEHVDNNFNPMPKSYIEEFRPVQEETLELLRQMKKAMQQVDETVVDNLREEGRNMKHGLSDLRRMQEERIVNTPSSGLQIAFLYLSTLQETQELISDLRHLVRASARFHNNA
jgi:hypothetical protein